MKNTDFTDGEWKISGTTRGLNGLYIGTDKQHIAQVFSSIPECMANATLISEAKNMYYALKKALHDIEVLANECNYQSERWQKEHTEPIKAILNRINK